MYFQYLYCTTYNYRIYFCFIFCTSRGCLVYNSYTCKYLQTYCKTCKFANMEYCTFVKEKSRLLLSSYSVYLVSDLGPVSLDVSCQRDSLARKRWMQNKGALGHELFKSSFVPRVKEGQLSVLGYYFKHIKWRDTGTRIRTRVVVNSERCATTELLVHTSIDKLL